MRKNCQTPGKRRIVQCLPWTLVATSSKLLMYSFIVYILGKYSQTDTAAASTQRLCYAPGQAVTNHP